MNTGSTAVLPAADLILPAHDYSFARASHAWLRSTDTLIYEFAMLGRYTARSYPRRRGRCLLRRALLMTPIRFIISGLRPALPPRLPRSRRRPPFHDAATLITRRGFTKLSARF